MILSKSIHNIGYCIEYIFAVGLDVAFVPSIMLESFLSCMIYCRQTRTKRIVYLLEQKTFSMFKTDKCKSHSYLQISFVCLLTNSITFKHIQILLINASVHLHEALSNLNKSFLIYHK
jgi:hypothetical protein